MLGHPKFNYGDKVKFICNGEQLVGTIEIIDAYGTFFDNSDVHYDIMVEREGHDCPCLYKHISEVGVVKED